MKNDGIRGRLICLLIALLCQSICGAQEATPEQEGSVKKSSIPVDLGDDKLYWIFLTTGKSNKLLKPEQLSKMQNAHLGNFKKLAEAGKLLTAGPMSDPNEKMRGIVVVKASGPQQMTELFADDPYIAGGYLRVEATEMQIDYGTIKTTISPQGLEEHRLIVFEQNSDAKLSGDEKKLNEKFISSLAKKQKGLQLTVNLKNSKSKRVALMIVAKPEDEKIALDQIKEIPAVKSGQWKSKTFPLFMGKGTLGKP